MKIKRFGITIKLNKDELYEAYLEQQHIFDMENIVNELETMVMSGSLATEKAIENILDDGEKISNIARWVRYSHEHDGMSYESAIEERVASAIDKEVDALDTWKTCSTGKDKE